MKQVKIDLTQEEIDLLKEVLAKYILIANPLSIYYRPDFIEEAKAMYEKIFMAEVTK